jgi:hypothetical protein
VGAGNKSPKLTDSIDNTPRGLEEAGASAQEIAKEEADDDEVQ